MKLPDPEVWLTDTSSIINLKILIPKNKQWNAFKSLEDRVREGKIAFPRQVIKEVSDFAHPDVPGVWVQPMRTLVQYDINPGDEYIRAVMATAGDLVEEGALKEVADPYLLAMALELRETKSIMVVTDDVVDRLPLKIAMTTACERLDLPWCRTTDFLSSLGLPSKKGT
jgi:rRNA maturation endonuclease Nob1